jgi:hypothetical protein
VHVFHPAYGFVWYCSAQRALITQTTVAYAHAEGARLLSDFIDLALREDAPGIAEAKGLFLFHDFRSLTGYATEARVLINERIKLRSPGYARRTIMVVRPTPIWRMAMHVTDLTFAMLGMPPAMVSANMERVVEELDDFTIDTTPPAWLAASTRR